MRNPGSVDAEPGLFRGGLLPSGNDLGEVVGGAQDPGCGVTDDGCVFIGPAGDVADAVGAGVKPRSGWRR